MSVFKYSEFLNESIMTDKKYISHLKNIEKSVSDAREYWYYETSSGYNAKIEEGKKSKDEAVLIALERNKEEVTKRVSELRKQADELETTYNNKVKEVEKRLHDSRGMRSSKNTGIV